MSEANMASFMQHHETWCNVNGKGMALNCNCRTLILGTTTSAPASPPKPEGEGMREAGGPRRHPKKVEPGQVYFADHGQSSHAYPTLWMVCSSQSALKPNSPPMDSDQNEWRCLKSACGPVPFFRRGMGQTKWLGMNYPERHHILYAPELREMVYLGNFYDWAESAMVEAAPQGLREAAQGLEKRARAASHGLGGHFLAHAIEGEIDALPDRRGVLARHFHLRFPAFSGAWPDLPETKRVHYYREADKVLALLGEASEPVSPKGEPSNHPVPSHEMPSSPEIPDNSLNEGNSASTGSL